MTRPTVTLRLGTRPGSNAEKRGRIFGARIQELDLDLEFEYAKVPADPDFDASKYPEHDPVLAAGLRAALLDGDIDVAVHAMKDLPYDLPPGVRMAAVPQREDPRDCLLEPRGMKLRDLPAGSRVAVDTDGRAAHVRLLRPDLEIVQASGPLADRADRARAGEFHAVMCALAAARRLALHSMVADTFGFTEVLPAAGQGATAIEIRSRETDLGQLLNKLDHPGSRWCVIAEREFEQAGVEAGVVVGGGYAELRDMNLHLRGRLEVEGKMVQGADIRPAQSLEGMGRELAERLIREGA